ncbi:MAG: hypothetical protein EXS10_08325 [Phycisphaerales bacterium]|nr:hypothetical protein [Phycisphaerales bacterium]
MPGLSVGTGLISGINSAALIEQLLSLESRGKVPIQRRISAVTAARTALLDVNARILAAKSAAGKLRTGKVFDAMRAAVGDDTLMAVSTGSSTPQGEYQMRIARMVSSSQLLSRGFASTNTVPAGLDALTFELGRGGVETDIALTTLNNGDGVRGGKIRITDRLFKTSLIDLGAATSLQEVVEAINADETVSVTAAIENERLVVRDTSGGGASFIIDDVTGSLAENLGIEANVYANTVTSSQLTRLGRNSALTTLNDGAGVLTRDGVSDFRLDVAGTIHNISLGREDAPITVSSLLSDLRDGAGIRINSTDADDFTVITSTGVSVGINLGDVIVDEEVSETKVKTVAQLLARVNSELETALGVGKVTMSLRADGKGFTLTDTMAGSGTLQTRGVGPGGDSSAQDLGIFTGISTSGAAVINGSVVRNKVAVPRATSIGDLIDRIATQTGGAVTATINSAGTGLQLSAGASAITVLAGTVDGTSQGTAISERTARNLGLFGLTGIGSVTGTRLASGVQTVRTATMNGGAGLNSADAITIQDRSGASFSMTGLAALGTLSEVISAINAQAVTSGVDVALSVSDSGKSLVAKDTSGGVGALTLSGTMATSLGIARTGTVDSLRGTDLQSQYVSEGSLLSGLNYGRGVGTGRMKLIDSTGATANVDIDSDAVTLYDVMSEINSRGLFIEARINANGDGLVLVDTNTGVTTRAMKVEDSSGGVAGALGIAKTATAAGDDIDGSYQRTVNLDTTDTLVDIVRKITEAKIPVSATVVNAGSGAQPFRIAFTSAISGRNGRLFADSGLTELGVSTMTEARDAVLVLGAGGSQASFVFTSSSNEFKDVVSGMNVTAKKVGETTATVTRDFDGILSGVKGIVTSLNDALTRINLFDKYDDATKTKGPLLGDPTIARAKQQIVGLVQRKAKNVEGRYQYLTQVGMRLGKNGQIEFDEARFREAYDTDPQAVEDLFTAYQAQSSTSQTITPGITVANDSTTYTSLGFSDLIATTLNKLVDPIDGVFKTADKSFADQLTGLNGRITLFDSRIEAHRTRMQRQFASMETTLAKLQSQQSAMQSMFMGFGSG